MGLMDKEKKPRRDEPEDQDTSRSDSTSKEIDSRPSDLITRYRPKTFEEVIGQEAVVRSLKTALKSNWSHAFAFTGGAGIGKTSLGRLIAKDKGCKKANLIEIDAATNSGVDAMRAITDTLQYAALGGGIRCVIIDEAHMLSKSAWASLLKIVEEPPPKVYWVFCTTEAGKIPVASNSRCASYQLKPVSTNNIRELLDKVVEAEGLDTSDQILALIASKSDGSPRRALAGLAKCAKCKDRAEASELMQVVGDEEEGDIADLCRALLKGGLDWQKAVELVTPLKDQNPESLRIVIVNWMTKALMDAKSDDRAGNLLAILDEFVTPYQTTQGIGPILLSLGRILL